MPFEVFMPGRDRGIDLRCISEPQHQFIVQVKHYAATGWSKLYSHLRRDELPKVKALSPSGYGLATSVPLTPDRKQKIVDLFSPFIDSSRHVWGQDDLNAMLRQHPDVERAHFKLWLTSTEVLTAVLHARVSARGRLLADEITERARLFVENSRLPHAVEILKNNRILVVSGTPGIGKTTLAEMLLAMLLADGYELHVVSADIDEAMDVYRAGVKQVFFYDDFL